nr:MAG: hypothetical protein DIU64_11580 [Caldicoprobacter oshimai]
MKYTQIQREDVNLFITIEEYIRATAPSVYSKLRMMLSVRDITEVILVAADVDNVDKYYQRIMQERPYPGRGGLLPGEGEEALV